MKGGRIIPGLGIGGGGPGPGWGQGHVLRPRGDRVGCHLLPVPRAVPTESCLVLSGDRSEERSPAQTAYLGGG